MLKRSKKLLQVLVSAGLCLVLPMGCGNRQSSVAAAPVAKIPQVMPTTMPQTMMIIGPAVSHYQNKGISFDYPADWVPDKAMTACFAVCAPKTGCAAYSSLSLDVPTLPWHLPGMITVGMVAHGYIDDLKSNQIHDAVVKDQHSITVCGCSGRQITCRGHEKGATSIDVAVILIHSDQVYILSADSDDAGYDAAKKTLDAAVASLKWVK
jgi:hypothetical protein